MMTHLGDRPPRRRARTLAAHLTAWLLLLPAVVGPTGQAQGQQRGPGPEYWLVQTRACPQILGTDPTPSLRAFRLDPRGCLARQDPAELLAAAAGRPVIFLVHGSYYTADHAATEGLRIRDDLAAAGAVPPDAVVVAFDWPSQRVFSNPVRDVNEKARRAFVAGYHLARFLQEFPAGSRIGLIGHSHGGLALLAALHLLGGGTLDDGVDACPPPALPAGGPALRLRAVVIAPACDRQWLDPGERFDRALAATEGLLCLYNPLDPVLVVHPFGQYSDHRRALGKAGLTRSDECRLGPLSSRYRERNIASLIGVSHAFRGSTAVPTIARLTAPYAWNAVGSGCPG